MTTLSSADSPIRSRQPVFLDRDGVINRAFLREGVSYPPRSVEEFEFLPGAVEATRALANAGFALVVVTNQPDVARGTQSRSVVEQMNQLLFDNLPILDVLTCYHDAPDQCSCRKPKPGMLLQAAKHWGLNLEQSYMVGDRWSDVLAGQKAGCTSLLILTPASQENRCQPECTVADLPEAAAWILSHSRLR